MQLLPNVFWSLTWAEFYHMAKGYVRRSTQRRNELIFTAWHIEAFARSKVLPKLESLIHYDDAPKEEQTADEMVAMVMLLNAAYGGEVVEVTGGDI